MAHQDRPDAHKTLPAWFQQASFHRPAGGVGSVQNPEALAALGAGLDQVSQSRHKGVDAGANVLQVGEQDIEGVHHLGRGVAHVPVETEHGDLVLRIQVVLRLDHVVLFVAPHAVLGAEGGGHLQVVAPDQGIEGVLAAVSDRRRMSEKGDPPAAQGGAPGRIQDELVDSEQHAFVGSAGCEPAAKRVWVWGR